MLQSFGQTQVAPSVHPMIAPVRDVTPARGLSAFGKRLTIKAGKTICADGEAAEYCYKIVSGFVRTVKFTQDGRRQVCDFLMPEDIIGLECRSDYTFSAEAVTTCTVLQFPRRAIDALMRENPTVALEIKEAMGKSLAAIQQRLVLLCKMPAKERVAWLLLHVADRTSPESASVDLPMPRGDIADYLGLANETVSRVITDLKESGIIATDGPRRIVFLDRDELESIRDAVGSIE